MATKVLLLGTLVALAAASLRPTTPEQLHQLLVWAQRIQDGQELARLHDKANSVEEPSRPQGKQQQLHHLEKLEQKEKGKQKQKEAQLSSPVAAWAPPPPPVSDDLLELLRPGLPANEEYDGSRRFSHSFLHGYRHAF